MKDNQKRNKNDQIYQNYALNRAGMFVQFAFVLLILVFAIISMFQPVFVKITQLTTGLTLLIMAYNNHRIYKRKAFTTIYIIIGILVLLFGVLSFFK